MASAAVACCLILSQAIAAESTSRPATSPAASAARLLDFARSNARKIEDRQERMDALVKIGRRQATDLAARPAARETLAEAVQILGQLKDSEINARERLQSSLWLARSLTLAGDGTGAGRVLVTARELAAQLPEPDGKWERLGEVAGLQASAGDRDGANQTIASVTAELDKVGPQERFAGLYFFAISLGRDGDSDGALQMGRKMADLAAIAPNAMSARIVHILVIGGDLLGATELAESIENPKFGDDAWTYFVWELPYRGQYAESFKAAANIKDEHNRNSAIGTVAGSMARAGQFESAEMIAAAMDRSSGRRSAFLAIAEALADGGKRQLALKALEEGVRSVDPANDIDATWAEPQITRLREKLSDVEVVKKFMRDKAFGIMPSLPILAHAAALRGDVALARKLVEAIGARRGYDYDDAFTLVANGLAKSKGPDAPMLWEWLDQAKDPSVAVHAALSAIESVEEIAPPVDPR
jgi:hypothetical protein